MVREANRIFRIPPALLILYDRGHTRWTATVRVPREADRCADAFEPSRASMQSHTT